EVEGPDKLGLVVHIQVGNLDVAGDGVARGLEGLVVHRVTLGGRGAADLGQHILLHGVQGLVKPNGDLALLFGNLGHGRTGLDGGHLAAVAVAIVLPVGAAGAGTAAAAAATTGAGTAAIAAAVVA